MDTTKAAPAFDLAKFAGASTVLVLEHVNHTVVCVCVCFSIRFWLFAESYYILFNSCGFHVSSSVFDVLGNRFQVVLLSVLR